MANVDDLAVRLANLKVAAIDATFRTFVRAATNDCLNQRRVDPTPCKETQLAFISFMRTVCDCHPDSTDEEIWKVTDDLHEKYFRREHIEAALNAEAAKNQGSPRGRKTAKRKGELDYINI